MSCLGCCRRSNSSARASDSAGSFGKPGVYPGDLGIELRCLTGKGPEDTNQQVKERRDAPLLLVEQGDGDAVASIVRVEPFHQAMVGKGKEVRLPRTPWPDQEDEVLVRVRHGPGNARQHVFHDLPTPHEEGLQ